MQLIILHCVSIINEGVHFHNQHYQNLSKPPFGQNLRRGPISTVSPTNDHCYHRQGSVSSEFVSLFFPESTSFIAQRSETFKLLFPSNDFPKHSRYFSQCDCCRDVYVLSAASEFQSS